MIKFFRKIRQNLLSEGKIRTYLKYAIGEIILVVIGILLALQINTWNENKKTYKLTTTHLNNIKKDLIADTTTFRSGIQRIENSLSIHDDLFNREVVNQLTIDSIIRAIGISFHSVRIYKINNSTFAKLTNSGFTESELFNDLFLEINDYYTREYNTWLEYQEWDKETKNSIFGPETFKNGYDKVDFIELEKSIGSEMETANKIEYTLAIKDYLKSSRFRNYAWNSHKEMQVILKRMKYQKSIAAEMIERIDAELEK